MLGANLLPAAEQMMEGLLSKTIETKRRKNVKAKYANLLCIIVAMIWGGGFLATDLALASFSPLTMLAIRFVGGALLGWIPVAWTRKKVSSSALKKGILSGALLYIAFAFQTFGLDLTETGMNAFLTAVNVILVPYIAWIWLKQRPKKVSLYASFLCLAGIGCLSLTASGIRFRFGDVLSLLCAVFFAAQIVALDGVKEEDPVVMNAIQLTTAAVLSLPLALFFGGWPEQISSASLWSCGYSIVFATFACYMMQTLAQKYTDPAAASVLLCTESLWANLFGWLFLHEAKSWTMILGGLLIFAAILLLEGQSLLNPSSKPHPSAA